MLRRTLLLIPWLCLLVLAEPRLSTDSPLPWLQIEAATGPHVSSQLALAPTIHNRDRLVRVLPYSVVIMNTGSTEVDALALVFTITKGGRSRQSVFLYNSFNTPREPVLAPGASRLLTPFRSYNALAAGASDAGLQARDGSIESEPLDDIAASDSIRASIDLVIDKTGAFTGPDVSGAVRSMLQQRQAYADLLAQFNSRVAFHKPVKAWLESVAAQRVIKSPTDPTAHHYATFQRLYAQQLLNMVESGRPVRMPEPDVKFPIVRSLKRGLQ